jgi:hypothetical protein
MRYKFIVFILIFCGAFNCFAQKATLINMLLMHQPETKSAAIKQQRSVGRHGGISAKNAAKIREVERMSRKVAITEAKIKKVEAQIAAVEARDKQ